MDYEKKIEIPFGANDSELKGWEYTIPKGMEAVIKDGKVIVREKESEDEKEYIRTLKSLIADFIRDKKPEDVGYYQRIYDWLDGRHIEQKDYRKLYEDIAKSEWFKKAYVGKSLGSKVQESIPLMNGDADLYFDNWFQKSGQVTSRQCFEEGVKYAQRWLQKEQKPVEYLDKDKVYAVMKKLMKLNFDTPLGSEQEKLLDEITCDVRSLLDYPIKSAEWTEKDEETSTNGAGELDGKALLYTADKSYKIGFRDGVASVKPVEWSEEDEDHLHSIVNFVLCWRAQHQEGATILKRIDNDISWLKALRDRFALKPHWKPSEEQMRSLLNAEGILRSLQYDGIAINLAELYEQLKKL